MSDDLNETPEQEPNGETPDRTDGVDWKAKSREWERRAKANAEAAKKLADIEESSKSESQRSSDRISELERQVADYQAGEQARQFASDVSGDTGVPAHLLRGATLDEVKAHAAAIKAAFPQAKGPVVPNEGTGKAKPGTTAEAFGAFIQDKLKN